MARKEKITVDRQEANLDRDLEKYRKQALDLGADEARVIGVDEIPVDERVIVKCQIPRCPSYGAGAH